MNPSPHYLNRREFTKATLLTGAAAATGTAAAAAADPRRIRTGLIGCGSVANACRPVLTRAPFVEGVSLCDTRPERVRKQAKIQGGALGASKPMVMRALAPLLAGARRHPNSVPLRAQPPCSGPEARPRTV